LTEELITPEQERAIEIILNAKLATDEDYVALAKLIDDDIADNFDIESNP
jgi:UDP-N-acetylenolpyruvoylglucosamine reductase